MGEKQSVYTNTGLKIKINTFCVMIVMNNYISHVVFARKCILFMGVNEMTEICEWANKNYHHV